MPVRFWVDGREFQGQAFLFDKDGTLITLAHWFSVMAERVRRFTAALGLSATQVAALTQFMGIDRHQPDNWGIIPLPRPEAEEAIARFLAKMLAASAEEILPFVRKICAEVDQDFPFAEHLQPAPGAEEVLRAIKRAGGKIGVVTNDLSSAARVHFRALGWEELVDSVVGPDICPIRKPAPEPIRVACTFLGVEPKESVIVGDTAIDLQAGRAAGCRLTVGVLTGLGQVEELEPLADLVLPDLRKLCFQ